MMRLALSSFALAVPATLALAAAAAVPSHAGSAPVTAQEAQAWREDLRVVATEVPRRQPFLYEGLTPTHLTPARWDSAVAALDARIPRLARHEILVGMEQIVALVGAGHTSINPFYDVKMGFRSYPLELYDFSDGVFVTRAAPEQAALVGARVVRIGTLPVEDARRRVETVFGHENEWFAKGAGMRYLMIPEVLGALGITPDMEHLSLGLERDGRTETVVVAPGGPVAGGRDPRGGEARAKWVGMRRPGVAPPLYLSHPETLRWVQYLPESRTLYVAYQSCAEHAPGPAIPGFFDHVFALADSLPVERFVIDVRDNLGGNSFHNRQLLLNLIRRPRLDRPGHLFVIIGRGTYSAAQNLVQDLERYTHATFVGEPTGSPTAFFGDHEPVTLPRSGVSLNIATLWWHEDPKDQRPYIAPRWYADVRSADYRDGVDPALRVIAERADQPTLGDRLRQALATGDSAAMAARLDENRRDPVNRFVTGEGEVNALGYSLLGAGQAAQAALVFRINARAFDQAATPHDSLGECYERLGYRAAAREQYRRALEIAPGLESAREALARLGDAP
jgi:hypothetical protein